MSDIWQTRFLKTAALRTVPMDDERGDIRSRVPAKEVAGLIAVFLCLLALYWFSAARL